MRTVELKHDFGLDNVVVDQRPKPEPQAGEVLLRMAALSLNHRDLLVVRGSYYPRQKLPLILASDGVGYVEQIGAKVEGVAIGQRVCPIFAQGWLDGPPDRQKLKTTLGSPLDGTWREYMTVPAQSLTEPPPHLTDEEAATLPCAGVTAYNALVEHGKVGEKHWVLILGTGGVSLFSLQLAKALGAHTIVTSKSDEKLQRAKALGADHVINYLKVLNWGLEARRISGGEGVDHVVEVGGPKTLPQSLLAVRPGGTISLIGILGGPSAPLDLTSLLMRQVRLQGVIVGPKTAFLSLNDLLARHRLRPIVDKVFGFEGARSALEYLAGGRHLGKVCVAV